jgi:1-phosphofructokinase
MSKIITVGLCPCWDIICQGRNLSWQDHQNIDRQTSRPAGKALNISRALAWMHTPNIAAGLWGKADYAEMLREIEPLRKYLNVRLTAVAGMTRRNVTVIDTKNRREMHLRSPCSLASDSALKLLQADLNRIVKPESLCVFSGSLPSKPNLSSVLSLVNACRDRGAKIILDTSGKPLRAMAALGGLFLLKPNVAELQELLGKSIRNTPAALIKAGRTLLDQAEMLLISRGAKGAVLVTKTRAWQANSISPRRVHSTVGCGDYLLAGFLQGLGQGRNHRKALQQGVQAAAARACQIELSLNWNQVRRTMRVQIQPVSSL